MRPRPTAGSGCAVTLLALSPFLLMAGCGEPAPVELDDELATAEEGARASGAQPELERALPQRGSATLRYRAGRVSVAAHAAARLPLLERLAAEADFELETGGVHWRPLTVVIEDLPLREALPLLLGSLPYQAEYAVDAEHGLHVLVFLGVGDAWDTAADAPPADAGAPVVDRWEGRESLASVLHRALDEGAEPEADQKALLARLDDPDPEVRMRAALYVEPEGKGLERLSDLLVNDPDPRVRAATTASLENGEGFAAVQALVTGLDDPDPEVVIEVIDSLEFAGDETNVANLEALLTHPDPRVREAAGEAIEFLGR